MLIPLKQFICDECGDIISSPEDGFVEWEEVKDNEGRYIVHGLRIVHKGGVLHRGHRGCYRYTRSPYRCDDELTNILGYAQQYMFSFMDPGMVHNRERENLNKVVDFPVFVNFFKRLTIPYYEEARRYFPQAINDGFIVDDNEIGLYTPKRLQEIIEHYSVQGD